MRAGGKVAERFRRTALHGRGSHRAQRPRPGHTICRARAGDLSRVRRRRQSVRGSRGALQEEGRPAQGSRRARQVDVAHRDQPASARAPRHVARAARRRERRGGRARSRDVRESVRRRRCTRSWPSLSHAAGDKQRTVRERAAIVALGPVDKAAALYELALAQHEAGDDAHARTSVLRSLEDAPNYEKAQTLLLTLYDARTKQAGGEATMNPWRIVGIACALGAVALSAGSAQTRPRRGGGFGGYFGSRTRCTSRRTSPATFPTTAASRSRASVSRLRALGRTRGPGLVARLSGRRREFREDPARHHERASVHRARADGRERARRASTTRCSSSTR